MRSIASRFALLALLAYLIAGCASSKLTFEPPLTTETEMITVMVSKVEHKRGRLRVWLRMKNKTEQTLQMSYGDFVAKVGDAEHAGVLRVFVKSIKDFDMRPGLDKKFNGPMEFDGVPKDAAGVKVVVKNIRVMGQQGSHTIQFDVPMQKQ
ncbi:MAG: hypothetical protein KDC87_11850 [Planctomycetes bacterium]|nr:hypothetical protein [Planctomycetota bacterium]MCB9869425.1 hypothetical protein [Planctomycetota bacterium]MCB9888517.1 hypothetical protein [Planctomycetota bacterium]